MKFSSYLNEKLIFLNVEGSSMEEIIKNTIEKMCSVETSIKKRQEEITVAVLKREEEFSTAIGKNIAVPHARIENLNDFIVVLATVKEPFQVSISANTKTDTIKLVVLIISDILKNKNILKILSAVSKLASKNENIADKISQMKSSTEILDFIKEINIEISNKITAEDVLSPDVSPVYEDTTLEEVATRLIAEKRVGIPVVSKDSDFLGEITEKELISFGMPKYLTLMNDLNFFTVGVPFEEYLVNEKTATIKDLYRQKNCMQVIDKKTPIMEICLLMMQKNMTRLYVVENNKYIGAIERSDIVKKILHL